MLHVVPERMISEAVRRFAEVEHINEPPQWIYEQVVGKNVVRESDERAKKKGIKPVRATVHEGDPARVIVDVAVVEGIDTIVMGTHGLSDIRGLVMGSVAHKVNHLAHCTVITVR